MRAKKIIERSFSTHDLKLSGWEHDEHSPLLDFTFSVTNKGRAVVKAIVIECNSFAESGTFLGRNTAIVYHLFPPGKTVRVQDIKFGFTPDQAESWNFRVVDAQIIEAR